MGIGYLLERELGCSCQGGSMKEPFLSIVRGQMDWMKRDEKNYLYHSFWLLITRKDRVVIGSAGFKGPPDGQEEVETGYGLNRPFEKHGFMTEAVMALCAWGLSQNGVKSIIAETEPDNIASQRVLKRCGMQKYRTLPDSLWWRMSKLPDHLSFRCTEREDDFPTG